MLPMATRSLWPSQEGEGGKAAGLGPDEVVQKGRISFEVVKGLIRSQVKDGPPRHVCTLRVYGSLRK
jgi:hypothetical protein